jgi:Asp-tRNA(Asn)/Glu-tRNA(Gln) amidotransferase A subunit family amidase
MSSSTSSFNVLETTIDDIHTAYKSGRLTSRQLVELYLDRIETYDKKGPAINAIITMNGKALEDADRLDGAFRASGPVGPIHGIPVIVKDQADIRGMPTTLGSLLFENYYPDRDAFVVEKLRKAGAIILAKATLGELGGGDTHGSLFGSTRNPYALDRTAGGSSGGSAASVSANFGTVAVGQEGFASIRRPATWNCVVGMRPTAGLVSRSGVYAGWPEVNGSLGPMARTVRDLAILLDVMAGYDPEDPVTARGVGHIPRTFTEFLRKDGLKGTRLGILREPIGYESEPDSEDFKKVTEVFDRAVTELQSAGAEVIDPIVIPRLKELQARRAAMALGEWVSVTSSRELAQREIRIETGELTEDPEGEGDELKLIYEAKGLSPSEADAMVKHLLADRTSAIDALAREELGIDPTQLGGSAWEAALTSFVLFAIGALVPILPFLVARGNFAVAASAVVSALGLFGIGAAITIFTGASVRRSGGRQLLLGLAAAGVTFGLGRLIGMAITG